MKMTDNWQEFWDRIEEGRTSSPVFFSRTSDEIAFENLPNGTKEHLNLSSGALCISSSKSLKWMPNDGTWVEL